MELFHCYASAAFGLEGIVAEELRKLNMRDVLTENGGVRFLADAASVFLCNLSLRTCDRVFIILAEAECLTFDSLFRTVENISWEKYAEGDEAINVSCKCTRSRLMSQRDCQSITKKAIIEKLKSRTGQQVFHENGSPLPVHVAIRSDIARILLNTSGEALSRRGYRTWNGEAPLRETLAAALVQLSPWKPGQPLFDPCCGTGTILIEAAFIAANRLPGINRPFAMEKLKCFRNIPFVETRKQFIQQENRESGAFIGGSDISGDALTLAARHIKQAGLSCPVSLFNKPFQEIELNEKNGVFICNPPYGERLSDQKSCRILYHDLHSLKDRHPGWSLCAITSDPAFERSYGKKADRKRRLYNGRLECEFCIYY